MYLLQQKQFLLICIFIYSYFYFYFVLINVRFCNHTSKKFVSNKFQYIKMCINLKFVHFIKRTPLPHFFSSSYKRTT